MLSGKFFRVMFGVLALGALMALPVAGQVASGSISGIVVDPSGAVVPNADVTATNIGTGAQAKATSDSSGLFRVPLLPGGTYRIEITKQGFQKLVVNGVLVSVTTDHGLGKLALKVGGVTTTVQVTGTTPLLQTSEAQLSNIIPINLLNSYPGIEENEGLDNLATSLPGVVNSRDVSFSNSNGIDFAVNGIRSRNNDQQIDGQNNNDNSVAGPYLFLSNIDFVQEYQIITGQFEPEYGRNSGSVVDIITKSGTNNWHGAISGTESNSALDALTNLQKSFEGLTKPPRYNDEFTSATIGGPIWRDKVFIFGGFDDEILSRKSVYADGHFTPTPAGIAAMAGCFPGSASVAALAAFGPYGVGGGNPVPSGTAKTVKLTGGKFAGFTPNNADLTCHVGVAGVQRQLSHSVHEYDWVYRTDVVLSNKDRFYGRYIYQRLTPFNDNPFGTAAAGYPANVPSLSQDIGLSWTHTFTSRMVNEARFSFGRLNVEFGGNSIGNTVPVQQNIANALARITFSDTSLLPFGPATNAPQGRIVNTYQLQDNWRYVFGRHQFKAGVNYTHQRSPNIFLPNFNGSFRFSTLSSFAQDVPNRVQIAVGNPHLGFKENDTFIYFGDDWKVTPNLTLNLGLTWSYYGQPANLFHDITTGRESNASTAFWNPSLPLSIRTFPKIPAPKNAFGPGIGFAYSPQWGGWLTGHGKTVFRGGYRLAYDPPYYNIYVNISSSAPQVLLQTLSAKNSAKNPLPAAPFGPAVRAELAPFLTLGVFDPRSFSQTTITPDFGPDRVHEWSFGVQRQLGSNAVFEARYVGNHGFDLFQSINANPFVADLAAAFPTALPAGVTPCPSTSAVVPSATGRVNCNEGVLRERTNTAYSDYNALQLDLRTTNLFKQLTMRATYTFSKTTDNVTEIFGTFAAGNTLAFSQNPLSFKGAEHGLSGLDIPHNFGLSLVEEFPFFRSEHGVFGHILGGWGTAWGFALASGQPFTPQQFALGFFSGAAGIDSTFDLTFAGAFETLRPFIGNPSAPPTSVGIFAGDACGNFAVTGLEPICTIPATTLISLGAVNTADLSSFVPTSVTKSQVRFIINGGVAQSIVGRPFGNAARNSLRDAKLNVTNITIFKNIKFKERATLRWHMTMLNAFNHPSYNGQGCAGSSIDPLIDNAGLTSECTGFANPTLTSGGNRSIRFGLKVIF